MRTKGKFWARFILLLALCAAAVFAWGSVGIVPTFAESGGNGRQGEVSLLALPENVTVAEITSVELTGAATTASSYEQIKKALTVTATGSDGEVYQLGSDEFELIGVFAEGAQETNQFRAVCGNVQSAATVELSGTPVGNSTTRSISAVFNNAAGTAIYPYTNTVQLKQLLEVTRYSWTGEATPVTNNNEYVIEGELTPTKGGQTEPYDKEITIRLNIGQETSNVSCTVLVTGITPAAPTAVLVTGPGSVTALSPYTDYDWTVQVMYAGGMSTIPLSACTVEYADSAQSTTDEDGNKYTGFVYDSGGGYLKVTYTEAGSASTYFAFVEVLKVPYPAPYMPDPGTYAYTAEDGAATTTAQDISIRGFNPDIMEIVFVQYSGSAAGVEPAYDTAAGTFEATEAGEYTVRVALTNEAYYFQDHETDETYLDLTYTLEPAEPPIGIEWSDGAYEGGELRWNRDDDVSFTLLNNYGGGDVTYTYSKAGGGTTTGSGTEPNLPNEAGTYTLTVRVAASGNFTAVEDKELATFTIGKRVLQAPTLSALTYTGAAQAPAVTYAGGNDASYLAVTNAGGTAAGEYTATFTIEDADEAAWSEEIVGEGYAVSGNTLTITYEIAKLEISAPSFTDPGYTYNGSAQTASLAAGWAPSAGLSIETPVTLAISDGASAELASGALTATDAGTYTVTASLGDTANLVWSDGETANKTFTWTIAKKAVDVPTFDSKTYNGTAQTADIAASSLYGIAQGSDWVDADTYTVTLTLTDGNNYKWAGDTNPDGETAAVKELSFTITPLELTIGWSDTSFTYDGTAHQPAATPTNAHDRDGIALTVAGAQTNAGGYTAEVTDITGTGKGNYTLPADATGEFTISPRVIEVEWGTLTHTYDGEAWNPAATVTNLASQDTVTLTYAGARTDAGTGTVTITGLDNGNYTIAGASGLSETFTITPKEIGIAWTDTALTYNGSAQKPTATATGTYDRDSISLTITGAQTNAGDGYTAEVTDITGTGADNYTLPADKTGAFTIARVKLDRPTEDTRKFVYSGAAQTYMPAGFASATMSIAGNVQTDADEGGYTVTVSIADKTNYAWEDGTQGDVTFTFIIEKKAIDLNGILHEPEGIDGNTNDNDRLIPYTADNRSHLVIDADEGIYSVERDTSSDDYGVYTATLTLYDPANYKWTGLKTQVGESSVYDTLVEGGAAVTVRYEITRAQFVIEIELDDDNWTYGENADHQPTIVGNISGGEVSFRYSTDANGTENVTDTMPTDVGTYYVIGYVDEAGSYAAAQSEAVSFTIKARTIGVTVSGADATYGEWQEVAIEDDDITGNAADDGGFVYDRVTASSLRLVYSTAGAQLAGDPRNAGDYTVTAVWADGVSIHTANFILDVTGGSFTISKKTIGISWSNTSLTYNGSAQAPTAEATGTVTGDDIALTVTGAQTDAGDGYTAKVTEITGTGADNYALPANAATNFDIDPYTIAVSIAVSAEDAVYGAFRGDGQVEITYTTPTLHGEDAQIALSYASDAYTDGKFNAGGYTVTATIGNANYTFAGGAATQYSFTIEKIEISIAIDGTATYGYAAAEAYAGDEHGSYEARVTAGGYADGEDFATLLVTGLTVSSIKTNYFAGDTVGEGAYVIYTEFTGQPANYTVTAVNGLLTVNKRAVTVYINNAQSDYNKDIAELTWSVTSGSFYGDQQPFTLATTAKKGDPVSSAGNTYYIYATRDGLYSKNYDITFTGSAQYNGEGAGVYTIGAATVNFNIAFLGTTLEYDGTAKQYTATIIGNEQVTLTPVYAYYDAAAGGYVTLGEGQDHAPVGVGQYRVTFTSEDENYTAASTSNDFEIYARTIGVTIEPDADLVYDAQGHPVSLTFTKDGGEAIVDADWSEGADYTVTYEGADGTVYAASSVAPTDVGSYKVIVRVIDENYAMADAELSFAIEKKALTVTVYVDGESAGTITYGDALDTVAFSVSYSGFADGENESFLTGSADITYLTDYDGEAYAPGAAAGTVYAVTTKSLSSDNYDIRVQAATLTVEKRAVKVTILDQTTTYTGVTAALAQDAFAVDDLYAGDAKGDLHVVLATDGVDAGTHDITATFENGNYDVTFAGNGSPSGGDTWGKLTIGQAELTVAVQDAHITYGDALDADELFSVRYSGFVGGEGDECGSTSSDLAGTISYTTASTAGGAAYAQGDAAGSTYTIKASGLSSSNYTIVFKEGTLTVDKRVVTVASVAPGSAQYNYGAAIGAVVRFRNEYAGAQLAEGADYFVQYKGTPFGTSGWGGSANNFTQNAPTDAGKYFAQIVLTNANYTFVVDNVQTTTSAPYDYNIAKRVLDVNWAENVIAYVSGQVSYANALRMSGLLDGFDAAILELGAVTGIGSGAGTVSVQPAADNNYTVTVTGVNIYSVTVTIRADYTYNYEFDEGASSTITFEVTADVNAIGIVAGADFDWTYGSPAEWTSDAGVLGNYFELDLGDARDIVLAYAQGDSADGTDLSYSGALPTDAGTYWLRAYYPGGANAGRTGFVYAQFTIRQAELAVPSLETQESTYNTDVYHGTPLTNKVGGYISGTMTVSSTATLTTSTEDGFTVIVQAYAAGEYTVTITLTDDNYVWAGDAADRDAVILTWTVHAAQDNAVTIPDAAGGNSWTYGEPPTELPQATATYGTAAYAYALLPDGFTGDDYTGLTWRGGFPTDAGAYVVRASVAATSDYNGAVAYKQFTILPAEIAVTGVAGYAGTYDGAAHNARTAGSAAAADGAAVTWQYSLTGTDGWQTAQGRRRSSPSQTRANIPSIISSPPRTTRTRSAPSRSRSIASSSASSSAAMRSPTETLSL